MAEQEAILVQTIRDGLPWLHHFDDVARPGMIHKIAGEEPTEPEIATAKQNYDALLARVESKLKPGELNIASLSDALRDELTHSNAKMIMRAISTVRGRESAASLKVMDGLCLYLGFSPLDIMVTMYKVAGTEEVLRQDVSDLCQYITTRGTKFKRDDPTNTAELNTKMIALMEKYTILTIGKPGPYGVTLGRISNVFPQAMLSIRKHKYGKFIHANNRTNALDSAFDKDLCFSGVCLIIPLGREWDATFKMIYCWSLGFASVVNPKQTNAEVYQFLNMQRNSTLYNEAARLEIMRLLNITPIGVFDFQEIGDARVAGRGQGRFNYE